ncbi:secretoglobin family 2B member 2 [Monodelphis domestica]|uniref:secretoglobin family 2B member 2 n=1 Tax=Monodelphis domestica TaxID=13616 RepID=UPI0024E198F3|nr:secretoglobin family 2B member 2 [Monodelphis domestica]
MKITAVTFSLVLVLALGSQCAESCPGFYIVFGHLASKNPDALKWAMAPYHPTKTEEKALLKIQECYKKAGMFSVLLDGTVMAKMLFSPECLADLRLNILSHG